MSNIGGGESFSRMVANAVIAGIKEKQDVVKQKLTDARAASGSSGSSGARGAARGQISDASSGAGGGGTKATTMDQIKAIDIQVDVQELSTISAAGTAIISTEKASAQAILRNV